MAIQSIDSSSAFSQAAAISISQSGNSDGREANTSPISGPKQSARANPVQDEAKNTQGKADALEAQAVSEALDKLNKFVGGANAQLQFSIDGDTDLTIVKIIDKETTQVIRQFPSAEAVQIAKVLDKLQGLLIRDKA